MDAWDWFVLLTVGGTAVVFAALSIVGVVLFAWHWVKERWYWRSWGPNV